MLSVAGPEPCLAAEVTYLKTNKPYRNLETENPLARCLSIFGPAICPEESVSCMAYRWDRWGFWADQNDEQLNSPMDIISFLRDETIRRMVVSLPVFYCFYLDAFACLLKIMVTSLGKESSEVEKIFREELISLERIRDDYPESILEENSALDETIKGWFATLLESIMLENEEHVHNDEILRSSFQAGVLTQEAHRILLSIQAEQQGQTDFDASWAKKGEDFRQLLQQLLIGNFGEINSLSCFGTPLGIKAASFRIIKSKVIGSLKRNNPLGAANVLRTILDEYQGAQTENFLWEVRDILFALLYFLKDFKRAQEVAKGIEKYHDLEKHVLREQIQEVLAMDFEPEIDPVAAAKEEQEKEIDLAVASFPNMAVYIQGHPGEALAITKRYAAEPSRAVDKKSITDFVDYLFMHGSRALEIWDVEEATERILSLLDTQRDRIRQSLAKNQFDKAWKIVSLVKHIARLVNSDLLRKLFNQSLESDEDFGALVANELIKRDWQQDEDLAKAYQDFLCWATLRELGYEYFSKIFSEQEDAQQASKKKDKGKKSSREAVKEVALAQLTEDPLAGWKFFVAAGPKEGDAAQSIEPSEAVFNEYFGNTLMVAGEEVLDKLLYLLRCEPRQRLQAAKTQVLYDGWRKLKRGPVRIFWRIKDTDKEIHFFVLNRKDAYRRENYL
jgi:mRNA-degrading endonuclease RelE of RelBE toxin-antitoxin system